MNSFIPVTIFPIKAFKDNYIWAMMDPERKQVFVVDPGEAVPVVRALKQHGCSLAGILLTHHHSDHSGGIEGLMQAAGQIPVIASHKSTIPEVNHPVKEGDHFDCLGIQLSVMEIPGHTLDHTAFYHDNQLVFCGDTLFSAGCGRVFEGTHNMMYDALCKLSSLKDETKIYCGHEYTLANLEFAKAVEPNNSAIQHKITQAKKLIDEIGCSLPSMMQDEKEFNPFLRCKEKEVIAASEKYMNKSLHSPVEVFSALRQWKNNF